MWRANWVSLPAPQRGIFSSTHSPVVTSGHSLAWQIWSPKSSDLAKPPAGTSGAEDMAQTSTVMTLALVHTQQTGSQASSGQRWTHHAEQTCSLLQFSCSAGQPTLRSLQSCSQFSCLFTTLLKHLSSRVGFEFHSHTMRQCILQLILKHFPSQLSSVPLLLSKPFGFIESKQKGPQESSVQTQSQMLGAMARSVRCFEDSGCILSYRKVRPLSPDPAAVV